MNFIPDDPFFEPYYDFVDELYENKHIFKKTNLIFVLRENCPNCITGKPNQYNGTGPEPFSFGPCPYCSGKNYVEEEITREISLRAYPKINNKTRNISNVNFDNGELFVIGKIEVLDGLIKAKYIDLYIDIEGKPFRYELISSPCPYGFGSKQFSCTLGRI